MNWRAFWALFRREVRRGRQSMAIFAGLAALAIVLAIVLSTEIAFVVATMSVMVGLFTVFAPLGDLRTDKTLGYLEFDRVLPIGHRAIATARLFGAAIRTSPLILFALPVVIAVDKGHSFGALRLVAAIGIPLLAWIVLTSFIWALMAVNIRWNLRRLWWLPMTIFLGPNIVISALPPAAKDAIAGVIRRAGTPMLEFLATPIGIGMLIGTLVAIPLVLFWMAISLFASGLERYAFDASGAIAAGLGAPPKRELAAIGRGPALAVARFCIRLATEQSRRRMILLAVFVAVLLFGSPEMKNYVKFYVRALAAMIPGGIALHLSVARTRGTLEGIQQLPHPAITIGAGYLLGILVLATPGAAVWVLARAVNGMPATASNAISLWAWMVGWSWLASVSVLWLTTRRTLMILSVPVLALVTWMMYVGPPNFVESAKNAALAFRDFRGNVGVAFPLLLASAMMIGGLPLFARGLNEYEFAGPKKSGAFSRSLGRVFRRRMAQY
jgi:hypothetical protein